MTEQEWATWAMEELRAGVALTFEAAWAQRRPARPGHRSPANWESRQRRVFRGAVAAAEILGPTTAAVAAGTGEA